MSLRYLGRVLYQAGANMRVAYSSRCDHATLKSLKTSAFNGAGGGGRQSTRGLSSTTAEEEVRLTEEALRTVLYLSCWGPF